MDLNCSESNGGLRPGAIVGGSFLVLVGVTMFLEREGLAAIAPWRVIGPACLIILGMTMLFNSGVIAAAGTKADQVSDEKRRRHNRRPAGPHHHRPCRPTTNSRPGIELPHAPFWKVGFARQGVWSSAMKMGCWLMSKMLLTAANRVIPLETPTS